MPGLLLLLLLRLLAPPPDSHVLGYHRAETDAFLVGLALRQFFRLPLSLRVRQQLPQFTLGTTTRAVLLGGPFQIFGAVGGAFHLLLISFEAGLAVGVVLVDIGCSLAFEVSLNYFIEFLQFVFFLFAA